jgi:hypothetical protein
METKLYQIVIGFSSQTPDYPSKITKGRFVTSLNNFFAIIVLFPKIDAKFSRYFRINN